MMRRAFSMMMAISVMVIMMGVSAMVFSLSNKIVFSTTTQFQKEQAILLAKSYTEYTLMALTAHQATVGASTVCLDEVQGAISGVRLDREPASTSVIDTGMGYNVETHISYIGNGIACDDSSLILDNTLSTNTSPNIIVDVYVKYRDTNFHKNGESPWLTYHRRTLQKI